MSHYRHMFDYYKVQNSIKRLLRRLIHKTTTMRGQLTIIQQWSVKIISHYWRLIPLYCFTILVCGILVAGTSTFEFQFDYFMTSQSLLTAIISTHHHLITRRNAAVVRRHSDVTPSFSAMKAEFIRPDFGTSATLGSVANVYWRFME